MGCDIHAHIEIHLVDKDGSAAWHHYAIPRIDRWYWLFGLLAGVRDRSVSPIVPPRGVPPDATAVTRMDYEGWGQDAHSASWFGTAELYKLFEKLQKEAARRKDEPDVSPLSFDLEYGILRCYLFGNAFLDDAAWPEGMDDLRMVFWFDN